MIKHMSFEISFCVKARPQISHLKGLYPVCILSCISSENLLSKGFPHVLHTCLESIRSMIRVSKLLADLESSFHPGNRK